MQIIVFKKYRYWLVVTNILMLLICGCQNQVNTQCLQISEISRNTNQQLSLILQTEQLNNHDFKLWMQAVDIFDQAIAELKYLNIKDEQLMEYQIELADLWQIYADVTNDAIQARKIKSLETLTQASQKVTKNSQLILKLTDKINNYCYK